MCAKFFYILIVLMAGLFPFKMQASETKQTFILYTPYTKISVPPGESISYSIDVINNSDEVKNATLALAGLPKSWSYEMKAGSWTLDEIAVLPGEKKNFTLKVDVPLKVNKGTYHFTIGADGLARLPLAITVSKPDRVYYYSTEYARKFKIDVHFQRHIEKPNCRTTIICSHGRSPQRLECHFQSQL